MKSVWIVEDHPLFRSAVRLVLSQLPGDLAIEEFGSLKAITERLEEQAAPDAILLDLNLPDSSGYEGVAALREKAEASAIVIMSASDDPDVVRRAAAIGAKGFVPKSSPVDTICQAVTAVLEGGAWWPETVELPARPYRLTPQQNRILLGLLAGRLNKQIAFDMGVSEATIKAHLTEMFRKLGVNNRTHAVIVARSLFGDAPKS